MTKTILKQYKGVAVFGAPGSGKTTMAKLLLRDFSGAKHFEAFETVIKPVLSLKSRLPKSEEEFIRIITRTYNQKIKTSISRDEASNFFTYLKNRYSSSVIAKTLINIHEKNIQISS